MMETKRPAYFERRNVKKLGLALFLVIVLTLSITSAALASGDKVRGDKGEGEVNQVQIQDPPPFQP